MLNAWRVGNRTWAFLVVAIVVTASPPAKADVRDIVVTLPPYGSGGVHATVPIDLGGPVQHIDAISCSVDVVATRSMYYCNWCRPEPILPGPCEGLWPVSPWFSISLSSGNDYVSSDTYVQEGTQSLSLEFVVGPRLEALFAQGTVEMSVSCLWDWWNGYAECSGLGSVGELRPIGNWEFTSDLVVHVEYAPAVPTESESFGQVKALYR